MSDEKKSGYQLFLEESPEVAQAFGGLINALSTEGSLDDKTRQLIYIGIRASQMQPQAVVAHVPMAKMAGASRDEIKDTILMTLAVCGITGVTNCLVPALDTYDGVA